VPIRHLETILQTLGDYASRTTDPDILNEYVRHSLSRVLCQQYRDDDGKLYVITLDPALEDFVAAGVEHSDRGMLVKLSPQSIEAVVRAVGEPLKKLTSAGRRPVVLCNPGIRAALKRMTAAPLPHLAVLSFNEVTRDTQVESVALVSMPTLSQGTAKA
jgi:flagellar biosynthesis protein FlhA